jgi:2'-5' RNA ligase
MKLLEFLESIDEKSNSNGQFIGVKLSVDSVKRLREWIRDNKVKRPLPNKEFHVTLLLDKKNKFPWNPAKYSPPIEIDPRTYNLELFGPNNDILVLSFSSPRLEKIHYEGRKEHSLSWDYDKYQPHITISPNWTGNIRDLRIPTFPIYLSHEYMTDFEDGKYSKDKDETKESLIKNLNGDYIMFGNDNRRL